MKPSVDQYFGEVYNRKSNNCCHFAAKVWANETGQQFQGMFDFLHGRCSLTTAKKFKKLSVPSSPCLVVFHGNLETHIGVYIRGKILHLVEAGVQYQKLDVVSFGFLKIGFYTC